MWKEIKAAFWPERGQLAISILLGIPIAIVQVATSNNVQKVFDDIFIKKDTTRLVLVPLFFIGLWIINGVCRYYHYTLYRVSAERAIARIRENVFKKFLTLGIDYYNRARTGEIMSRISNDVQVLFQGFGLLIDLVREPISLIALLIHAFLKSWELSLVTLTAIPVVAFLFDRIGRAIKRYGHRSQEVVSDLASLMSETFSGIRVVKSFNLEPILGERFSDQNDRLVKVATKTIVVEELNAPVLDLVLVTVAMLVVYVGGKQVIDGHLTPGQFFAFLTSLILLLNPIRKINNAFLKMNVAKSAAERITTVLREESSIQDGPSIVLGAAPVSLSFHDVSFGYEDKKVLDRVSFELVEGKQLALVGPSGAGKTTVFNLILRFFDVKGGQIQYKGKDIRQYQLKNWRDQLGLVSQDVFLFHDSIKENLLCVNRAASAKDIDRALEISGSREFVHEIGLDSIIGERGVKLSGGQRQRLSIARAVLKNAPILLLDEATSALDTESEKQVQGALDQLMSQRTCISIAHRLSTIKNADEILVMEQGKIAERGNHNALMARGGLYQQLVKLQSLDQGES